MPYAAHCFFNPLFPLLYPPPPPFYQQKSLFQFSVPFHFSFPLFLSLSLVHLYPEHFSHPVIPYHYNASLSLYLCLYLPPLFLPSLSLLFPLPLSLSISVSLTHSDSIPSPCLSHTLTLTEVPLSSSIATTRSSSLILLLFYLC